MIVDVFGGRVAKFDRPPKQAQFHRSFDADVEMGRYAPTISAAAADSSIKVKKGFKSTAPRPSGWYGTRQLSLGVAFWWHLALRQKI